ncbi:tyrosine-protein phosphatase [Clostridium cylindrosporum]|uniref:Protein tyrosine/serine phosphatase n=1 Tax=Clostridium cylindrosporum DSM 605 TaxID=1121307 RepID=A0A0J8DBA6_CLOCY|nr:tyrosine-protein phosphatase [Clostridium cylindrosporum]KMT23355.1 protein tyrosine/serine phosphatase [Clostridium cylindrosporum DSM 605]
MWIILIALAFLAIAILVKGLIMFGGRGVEDFDYENLIMISSDEKVNDRFIALETTFNTRDIGGYKTEAGERVKRGKIFRSDRLYRSSKNDINYLEKLDIKTSVDLRENSAFKRKPNRLPSKVQYLHMPVFKKVHKGLLFATLFDRKNLGNVFCNSYIFQLENSAKTFGSILHVMSFRENLPLMYNCTSGKDRTGIVTALLLSLLGVKDEVIIRDYSLSNLNFSKMYESFSKDYEKRLKLLGANARELKPMIAVNPDWMKDALKYIRKNYGSAEYYLLTKAGLPKDSIERLRYNLLERDESFLNI